MSFPTFGHRAVWPVGVMCRVLRVARTIADLEERAEIDERSVAEALRYRPITLSALDLTAALQP